MTHKEKLNVLTIFLERLKNNNMVCRQDVLSLEEMLGNNIFTGSKDIVYLSPTSSCVGVQEVQKLVEKEIDNVKNESYVSFTEYIHITTDAIDGLNSLKTFITNELKVIRSEVINLLKDPNFTLFYKTEDGENDPDSLNLKKDYLAKLDEESFFAIFLYHREHVKKLCSLNQEKGEGVFENLVSLSESYRNDSEIKTPIIHIFNALQCYGEGNKYFNLKDAPVSVFTLSEFVKLYYNSSTLTDYIDTLIGSIQLTTKHSEMPYTTQEEFGNMVSNLDNLLNMLSDKKLSLLQEIVRHLAKL